MSRVANTSETYEQALNQDLSWAMADASRFFAGEGSVQKTLRKISQELTQLQIPFAICGGMALFAHGYRRFTEDVDILISANDLPRIHSELSGRGYIEPFASSKNLRDTETKVKIEFLLAGQFPGDGKPKPVAFPDPLQAQTIISGISYLRLERLIELKLASGMSAAHRLKDLADVIELIRALKLPREVVDQLDASVQGKFVELWTSAGEAEESEA